MRSFFFRITPLIAGLMFTAPFGALCAQDVAGISLEELLQQRLVDLHAESGIPGISVGIVWPDGRSHGFVVGMADTLLGEAMERESRLLSGSVGKTYVSAVAMQLVHEGVLDLDAHVSSYLGTEPWYGRLPNHADITVRQLMSHTSGLVRYEFDDRFISDLLAEPDKVWRPEELVAYLFDTEAPFAAGEGWDYSDTNYIVLGMIMERLTGNTYYDEMKRRVLEPLGLENTVPSNSRRITGLVQGYAGVENPFRLPEAVLHNGTFAINPQFEWTGGGIASTAEDLARWGKALYEGRAFDPSMLPVMLDGVPARLGPNTQYGLGVIIRETPFGVGYGHSGFFPGYLAEMMYFPDHGIAIAVQVNTSDVGSLNTSPGRIVIEMVRTMLGG